MKNCPICGTEVGAYHELRQKEPYIHNNPYDGIHIYGAYSAPKETLCFENDYLHFAFYDADENLVDHRLVKLNVEFPMTQSPSEEYMLLQGSEEDENDFEEVFDETEDNEPHDPDGNGEDELPF
jgi:hypothetical protein